VHNIKNENGNKAEQYIVLTVNILMNLTKCINKIHHNITILSQLSIHNNNNIIMSNDFEKFECI